MIKPAPVTSPPLVKVVLAFLAVYVIWGSTYLGIKFCLETIHTVFLMPGVRFFTAGALLYVWARPGVARPTLTQWRDAAIIGGALLFIANGSVVWAETRVPSGLTALLIAVVPMCMVLFDWLRPGGTRPTRMIVAGLLLGLVGIGVLTGPDSFAGGKRVDPLGAAGLLLACVVWSAGSLYSKSAARPDSPYLAAAMQMIAGGVLHLITGTLVGEWSKVTIAEISGKSFGALVYLILFGSIVAFTAYMWLMQVSTPARVATYAYVNPVVAVLLGWSLGNEELDNRAFLATGIIVAAVAFITTGQSRKPAPSANAVESKEKIGDLKCKIPRSCSTVAPPTVPCSSASD